MVLQSRLSTENIAESERARALGHCLTRLLYQQIGFLYLRYVGSPRTLWDWVQPYVRDSEVCLAGSCEDSQGCVEPPASVALCSAVAVKNADFKHAAAAGDRGTAVYHDVQQSCWLAW